ncbi:unnamed protein product, partial [Lampetra fluviatilis]
SERLQLERAIHLEAAVSRLLQAETAARGSRQGASREEVERAQEELRGEIRRGEVELQDLQDHLCTLVSSIATHRERLRVAPLPRGASGGSDAVRAETAHTEHVTSALDGDDELRGAESSRLPGAEQSLGL